MKYVLALDQGTTSSRALLFDEEGVVRAVAQREFDQIFPQPGWVEHDPEQIASSQIAVALEALAQAKARPNDVAAIGIANQRETTIVWDRETGAARPQRHRLARSPHRRFLRTPPQRRPRPSHPAAHRTAH